jgi:hypothetical protein
MEHQKLYMIKLKEPHEKYNKDPRIVVFFTTDKEKYDLIVDYQKDLMEKYSRTYTVRTYSETEKEIFNGLIRFADDVLNKID